MNIKNIIISLLFLTIASANAMELGKKRKRSDSFDTDVHTTDVQIDRDDQVKCVRQDKDLNQLVYLTNQSDLLASNEILERMFNNKLNEWKINRAYIAIQIKLALAQGTDPNAVQLFEQSYEQLQQNVKVLEGQLVTIYNRLALIQQRPQITFNELYDLLIELKRI